MTSTLYPTPADNPPIDTNTSPLAFAVPTTGDPTGDAPDFACALTLAPATERMPAVNPDALGTTDNTTGTAVAAAATAVVPASTSPVALGSAVTLGSAVGVGSAVAPGSAVGVGTVVAVGSAVEVGAVVAVADEVTPGSGTPGSPQAAGAPPNPRPSTTTAAPETHRPPTTPTPLRPRKPPVWTLLPLGLPAIGLYGSISGRGRQHSVDLTQCEFDVQGTFRKGLRNGRAFDKGGVRCGEPSRAEC